MRSSKSALHLVLLLLFALAVFSSAQVFALPEGVDNITIVSSERKAAPGGAPVSAQGGNITRLNITVRSQTIAWQGFAGNISGRIVLDDASADRFYSWNLTNISGEIYASRNTSLNFNNVFPQNNCTIDEVLTGTRSDRVSRTYFASTNTVNFSVGTTVINSSTACSVRPFVNSTIQSTTNLFENVILSPETNNATNFSIGGNQSIYVGILQDAGTAGFDGQYYNFQVLVPVNRTSGFTTYYFYAEVD